MIKNSLFKKKYTLREKYIFLGGKRVEVNNIVYNIYDIFFRKWHSSKFIRRHVASFNTSKIHLKTKRKSNGNIFFFVVFHLLQLIVVNYLTALRCSTLIINIKSDFKVGQNNCLRTD